ncbi:hypothetical protein LWC35_19225 [Pseudonocardia kujensis]|nr:hypothetical protein [Pseudonocardia kujensis]MCE0765016.1 hypothetical protein [Pseudonocardia kujensis]
MLHSFGREDQLDREVIGRLVAPLSRLLDPATALRTPGQRRRRAGRVDVHLLAPGRGHRGPRRTVAPPRVDTVMARLLEGRTRDPRTERVLFAWP